MRARGILKKDLTSDKLEEIAGLVLAGGLSRRMGENKALMRPDKRQSLLERSFSRLHSICADCYVSCAKGGAYPGFDCIEDVVNPRGPMAGIISALRSLQKYRAILALACDMPLMTSQMLLELVKNWQKNAERPCLVAWQSVLTGKIQMLCALYSLASLPHFEKAYQRNEFALWNIVPPAASLYLPYGPEKEKFFLNCNTRADISCVCWEEME